MLTERARCTCRSSSACDCAVGSRPYPPRRLRAHVGCPLEGGGRFTFRRRGARAVPDAETNAPVTGTTRGAPCGCSPGGAARTIPFGHRVA